MFQGVTTDAELAKQPLLLLDVGGGSTEFILGHGAQKRFAHSFPLGTVRLLEKFPHSDPPTRGEFTACRDWLKDFLHDEVRPMLEPALRREVKPGSATSRIQLVGTGGTTSILARIEKKLDRFDRERIESTVLSREQVDGSPETVLEPAAGRTQGNHRPAQIARRRDSHRRCDLRGGHGGI